MKRGISLISGTKSRRFLHQGVSIGGFELLPHKAYEFELEEEMSRNLSKLVLLPLLAGLCACGGSTGGEAGPKFATFPPTDDLVADIEKTFEIDCTHLGEFRDDYRGVFECFKEDSPVDRTDVDEMDGEGVASISDQRSDDYRLFSLSKTAFVEEDLLAYIAHFGINEYMMGRVRSDSRATETGLYGVDDIYNDQYRVYEPR